MRKYILAVVAAVSFVTPAFAGETMTEEERQKKTNEAIGYFNARKPAETIAAAKPVLESFEADFAKNYPDRQKTDLFCAETSEQTLTLTLQGSTAGKDTVVLNRSYCEMLFITGFAMIDAGQQEGAGAYLQKASEMSPLNAHFMNEYAEWHKSKRDWKTSFALFKNAREISSFTPEEVRKETEARSMRGMGFNMIELGDLDGAEKLFKESLKLTPGNSNAVGELVYIEELRKK
jgi:Flp pilus assembly protein TadD